MYWKLIDVMCSGRVVASQSTSITSGDVDLVSMPVCESLPILGDALNPQSPLQARHWDSTRTSRYTFPLIGCLLSQLCLKVRRCRLVKTPRC